MIYLIVLIAAFAVAYANGANDNFKGVATLFGSGTTNYRRALAWATVTTLLGSLAAFFLAGDLIASFGGKGLIDDAVAGEPAFAGAVVIGAALTVLIATRVGMPISTTHSLLGGLLGAGVVAGSTVNTASLGDKFVLPLLLSPVWAVAAAGLIYPLLRRVRRHLGVTCDTCLCVGNEVVEVVPVGAQVVVMQRAKQLAATIGDTVTCETRYQGQVLGLSVAPLLDRCHFLSAGIVSFARGLNDTPKIAAMLLIAPYFGVSASLIAVGLLMAIGGVVSARRVAETMSKRITTMNHGQGFTANAVTGLIVIGASHLGLPVSTTHVSCGSLFGIGTVTGGARRATVLAILAAWFVTLPLSAAFAAVSFLVLSH